MNLISLGYVIINKILVTNITCNFRHKVVTQVVVGLRWKFETSERKIIDTTLFENKPVLE